MRFLEWQTDTEEEKVSLITVFLDAWAFLWSFVHNIIFIFSGNFFLFFSFLCHFSKCAQNIHYFVVIIFSRNWTLLFDCDVTIDVVCVCRRIDKSKWQERNQELSASEQNEDSFIHRQRHRQTNLNGKFKWTNISDKLSPSLSLWRVVVCEPCMVTEWAHPWALFPSSYSCDAQFQLQAVNKWRVINLISA